MNQMAVPTQNIYNICSVFKNIIAWSQLQKDFLFVCFKLWSKRKLTEVILTGQWQWLGIIHRERLRVTDLHGCLPEGRRRPRGGSWAQPGWRRCCSRMTCSWSTSTGWAGLEDSIVKHINTDGYAKALRCLYSKNCPVFQTNQVSLSIPLSQSWKKRFIQITNFAPTLNYMNCLNSLCRCRQTLSMATIKLVPLIVSFVKPIPATPLSQVATTASSSASLV